METLDKRMVSTLTETELSSGRFHHIALEQCIKTLRMSCFWNLAVSVFELADRNNRNHSLGVCMRKDYFRIKSFRRVRLLGSLHLSRVWEGLTTVVYDIGCFMPIATPRIHCL